MDAQLAAALSHELIRAHGLASWSFAFNRRKRSLGLCRHDLRRIELSLPFVLANDEAAVRETILHEIAHALAGRTAGHGPRWRLVCVRIGIRPERCCHTAVMPLGRWRGSCPTCGKEYHRHHRPKSNRQYACRRCGPKFGLISFARAA